MKLTKVTAQVDLRIGLPNYSSAQFSFGTTAIILPDETLREVRQKLFNDICDELSLELNNWPEIPNLIKELRHPAKSSIITKPRRII